MAKDNDKVKDPKDMNNEGTQTPEEPKNDEPKANKDWLPIRLIKGGFHKVCDAARCVNDFAHNHPWVLAGIATGVTTAAVKGYELITGQPTGVDLDSGSLTLPEAQTEEPEAYIDMEPVESPVDISTEE